MPGLDRRGPMGAGSVTGGRRGLCARPGGSPNYGGLRFGRRAGLRGGYGGRFGRDDDGYPLPVPVAAQLHPDDELEMLRAEQRSIQRSLEAIERRIAELGTGASSE